MKEIETEFLIDRLETQDYRYLKEELQKLEEHCTCDRGRYSVGLLLSKGMKILMIGANRSVGSEPTCMEHGHLLLRHQYHGVLSTTEHCSRTIHPEQDLISRMAFYGTSTAGTIMVLKTSPCSICTKLIINSGISEVIYFNEYPSGRANTIDMLIRNGIKVKHVTEVGYKR